MATDFCPEILGLIAGNGVYPLTTARAARQHGVKKIIVTGFVNETDPALEKEVDVMHWLRVGQLGKMIKLLRQGGARHAIMAGQIAPKNLFDLRPDLRALFLLSRVKIRNAESLFGAIGDELKKDDIELLSATTFLDDFLAPAGRIFGPAPSERTLDDLRYGFSIAKEVSRLDIGQTVVVKKGTVLAVEGFEGTDECVKRGGTLGRGEGVMVKVSKPKQDLRFDVPVVGPRTIETAAASQIHAIGVEAQGTLLLDPAQVDALCHQHRISLYGLTSADL
jgi:UDP-2,3-diacylglucosamine hydrolase